jgi:SAM-dependent methyltransferase
MRIWLDNRSKIEDAIRSVEHADACYLDSLVNKNEIRGYCSVCDRPTVFAIRGSTESWNNYSEDLSCACCNLNSRHRNIIATWREVKSRNESSVSVILERVTPMFSLMQREDPSLIGCEFLSVDHEPGLEYEFGGTSIRHEDFGALSMDDNSVDLLMHFDVMEHVPDRILALKESFRILRNNGISLFSVPFFPAMENNLVRAVMGDQGSIEHFQPPAYHGNPVSGKGALVFFEPGWQFLDEIIQAGFSCSVSLTIDPAMAIVSNGCPYPIGKAWPLIFMARKP